MTPWGSRSLLVVPRYCFTIAFLLYEFVKSSKSLFINSPHNDHASPELMSTSAFRWLRAWNVWPFFLTKQESLSGIRAVSRSRSRNPARECGHLLRFPASASHAQDRIGKKLQVARPDWLRTHLRHLPNQQSCNLNLLTRKRRSVSPYFLVNKPPARNMAPRIK